MSLLRSCLHLVFFPKKYLTPSLYFNPQEFVKQRNTYDELVHINMHHMYILTKLNHKLLSNSQSTDHLLQILIADFVLIFPATSVFSLPEFHKEQTYPLSKPVNTSLSSIVSSSTSHHNSSTYSW